MGQLSYVEALYIILRQGQRSFCSLARSLAHTDTAQVTIGYALMLVVMTYNAELFLCTIAGLVVGHAFFNMKAPVTGKPDPCCQYDDGLEEGKITEGKI